LRIASEFSDKVRNAAKIFEPMAVLYFNGIELVSLLPRSLCPDYLCQQWIAQLRRAWTTGSGPKDGAVPRAVGRTGVVVKATAPVHFLVRGSQFFGFVLEFCLRAPERAAAPLVSCCLSAEARLRGLDPIECLVAWGLGFVLPNLIENPL
jgi:hypothetical protein